MAKRRAAEGEFAPASAHAIATPKRDDTLRYIAEMAAEMAALAGAARLPMLTYFLNMARVEAEMALADAAPVPVTRRTAGPRRVASR